MEDKYQVLKPIQNILSYNFKIPSYQRGYRWEKQQVEELLNDINDFDGDSIYCLQPLVVKSIKNEKSEEIYEVIDGQQRLTTIFVILKYLNNNNKIFSIEYETRKNSEEFLNKINNKTERKSKELEYIDFYYMSKAYETIESYFETKDNKNKEDFENKLLKQVNFIWYKIEENHNVSNSIDIFSNMNMGKIPLTDAELIKAFFVLKQNDDDLQFSLRWDEIEKKLQDDSFWYFLSPKEESVRINLLFKCLYENPYKEYEERYKNNENFIKAWQNVKNCFGMLLYLYNNNELYHYIGYLTNSGSSKMNEIYKIFQNSNNKEDFKEKIIEQIKQKLKNKNNKALNDLTYDEDYNIIKNILLLFNIQTHIDANKTKQSQSYNNVDNIYYKFPFYLYQKENWDIEHVDSQTENPLKSTKDKKEWLEHVYKIPFNLYKSDSNIEDLSQYSKDKKDYQNTEQKLQKPNLQELKKKIDAFLIQTEINSEDFEKTYKDIIDIISPEDDIGKDTIHNLTLLNSKINRSYGNNPFYSKRKEIIEKDKSGSFIPICTKNLFLKYYTDGNTSDIKWTEKDKEDYFKNINEKLKKFIKESK